MMKWRKDRCTAGGLRLESRRHFAGSLVSEGRDVNAPLISVVMFAIAALLGAVGQYLYKAGAATATGGIGSYLLNARLLGGVVCYIAVMVLFVAAFKRGGALTVLYPIYASTFIWAAVIAYFADGAPIRAIHVGGFALLIGGMYLLGK